jgi:hypothetical protein
MNSQRCKLLLKPYALFSDKLHNIIMLTHDTERLLKHHWIIGWNDSKYSS